MTLDAKARKTADRLIAKFGKLISITSITEGTYNPTTGELDSGSTSAQTVAALISDYNGIEFSSGLVEKDDKKITVASLNTSALHTGDTVQVDNDVYKIVSIKNIWSGELTAVYELQVRK